MDQQALSNAFMSSFPWIQANSSEATNIQNGSETTNFVQADFSSTTESTGKSDFFNTYLGLAKAIKLLLRQSILFSIIIFHLCKKQ